MAEFTMPSLGADMDKGTLQEWLVQPGELVRKGDPVAVIETAKSSIEVECFATGRMGELLIEPGTTVPVGTPLALIEPAAEGAGKPEKAEEKPPVRPAPAPVSAPPAAQDRGHVEAGPLVRHLAERTGVDLAAVQGSGHGGRLTRTDVEQAAAATTAAGQARVRATPLARRLAAERGVDLAAVTGTGRDSAIRAADVRKAAPGPTAAGPRHLTVPVRPSHPPEDRTAARRQAIAGLMTRANRDIPHYYLSTTIDMAPAMGWLHEHNRRSPVAERILPAALLLKAAALAAREVPELNGFWTDDHYTAGEGVHLGVAVSLRRGGLVAPALHDADTLELRQLMNGLKDLVARARTGRLRSSEVSDPTITVTNLGDQGVETVFGVIYPPQVALVGFGRIVDRPCAVDGLLGVRPVVTATLSADHRATDGAVGAHYLTAVDHLLHTPEQL
ncbi:dihydrolipoamide acetyltransferase family protein [Streptomyces malaysiense]|uniref:Dihydrolipoamide acetyltransferase component of pyruvate dehydrogenase complex n=1 Tax=Streptomyces malaysiense TaxID=1428626 RepID=A0A1J4PZI3_9ACTN|nr:dihydrolipoamide acetyltransferase family protein [Streptomyces malaysiense]OIK26161.1 dehydrogenase [Streptomyces malaysiense]